jgi:hypothetical protein
MVRTTILAVAALGWLSAGAAGAAENAKKVGSFVVNNPTTATIRYEVRWGHGEWKTYTLEPGDRRCHYHTLSVHNTVPTPKLRYDCDLAEGEIQAKMFEPQTGAVTDQWRGTGYTFRTASGGRFAYLYED